MEIIIGRFKGRSLWITETFGTIITMFIVWVLMMYAWDHFMRAWSIGDSSIDVEITLWPSKILVPLAFAMLTIRLLIQLVGFLRLLLKPDALPIGIPEMESVEKTAEEEIKAGLGGDMEGVILPTVETTKDAR